ncbi:MAG: amidohydrolase family protein [Rhodobacteraceae bacterium]|nr:amidohydrolase family protein [Paracoccaceae bacterium]MCY4197406.1 amidohydrolase family protein [Paracoccaceae bacterium]
MTGKTVSPPCRAIDAHHHLWNLDDVHYPWLMATGVKRFFGDPTPIQRHYLVEEFKSDAASAGCVASVHIQVGAADSLSEARWVQSVSDLTESKWPAVQVAHCDLTLPETKDTLAELCRLPSVRGIRQIIARSPEEDLQSGPGHLLKDTNFKSGLRLVADCGLSFDLQLIPELLTDTAALLEEIPELPVALCHAGSPRDLSPDALDEWKTGIRLLSSRPRTVCKISGLGMFHTAWRLEDVTKIVTACLDAFGADRCMFGSNFPVDSLSASYNKVFDSCYQAVPEAMQHDVFFETARQFYGIPDQSLGF